MAASEAPAGVAADKDILQKCVADTNEMKNIVNRSVVRINTMMKGVTATWNRYDDLEDEADKDAVKQAVTEAVNQLEALVADHVASIYALNEVYQSAQKPRTNGAAMPNFDDIYAKALAAGKSKVDQLFQTKADNEIVTLKKDLAALRKQLNAAEGDIAVIGGNEENRYICMITRKTMVNPMRTPCGHIFSEQGINILAAKATGAGKTFKCGQHACNKMIKREEIVPAADFADELELFTQKQAREREEDEDMEDDFIDGAGAGAGASSSKKR